MSKKDYVVFLDADDELSPRAIDTYTQIIEKNNHIDFLVSNFNINKDGNLRKNKNFSIRKDPLMAYLNRKLILHTNGWCIKREYLMDNAVYFDEELSWGEDVLFFSEVFLHNGEHILIEDYLSTHYAGVKDSLSENTLSKIDEDILWLNKLSQIIEQTKKDSDHYLSLIKGYRIPGVIIYRLLFNIDRDYDKTMYYYQKYKNNLNYLPIVNGLRSIKLKIKYLELKFRIAFKKVSKKKSV